MPKLEQSTNVHERIKLHAQYVGNKAANLQELDNLCQSEPNAKIPAFYPLDDSLIKAHMKKYAPEWQEKWTQFLAVQGDNQTDIIPDAKMILTELRLLIEDGFNHPGNSLEDTGLSNFLNTMSTESNTLMVRSTGEEDSVELANPGGNKSISAVAPDTQSVLHAVGQVVASYFSEKSLKQRLLSTGQAITQDAFVPVLLQSMIGEPVHGFDAPDDIIRSGVMYTSEDMCRIQIAPGHGELVVDSQAPFDTFEVTRENMVYATIAQKTERLVPSATQETGLIFQKNPKSLQASESITQSVALRIAHLGQRIEKHYGMPMDVEFVYSPKQDIIYLVQARPIPAGDVKTITPSSVPPEGMSHLKKLIKEVVIHQRQANVITSAGFAAKILTNPSQLLIRGDIDTALNDYLRQDNSSIQAVLVHDLAATTSHAAAFFNSKAIPVLQVSNLNEIEQWNQRENAVLMIDPQRNQILDVTGLCDKTTIDNRPVDLKQLFKDKLLFKEGLFTFPIQPITAKPVFTTQIDTTPATEHVRLGDQIEHTSESVLRALHAKIDTTLPLDTAHLYTQLMENITALETPSATQETTQALQTIRTSLTRIAQSTPEVASIYPQAMLLCEEIERNLSRSHDASADKIRESQLSLVARLMSLVSYKGNPVIFSDSIRQTLQEKKSQQALPMSDREKLSPTQATFLTQFLKLNSLAFTENTKNEWQSFATHCVKKGESIQRLAKIIQFNVENHLGSDLVNNQLQELYDLKTPIKDMLPALYERTMAATQEMTSIQLDDKKKIIEKWEHRIGEWGNREKFDSLLDEYNKDMDALINALNSSNAQPLTQKVILNLVHQLTNMMDNTIKSAKGSPDYQEDQALLVQRFVELLKPYHQLMRHWVNKVPDRRFSTSYGTKKEVLFAINEAFLSKVDNTDPCELAPSGDVSIAAINIGSTARFNRQFNPELSLEDLFSLMHQNLLTSISLLNESQTIPIDRFPEKLHPLLEQFEANDTTTLLRITTNSPVITFEYNQPLKNHSAKYIIEYNTQTEKMTLHGYIMGENWANRMNAIAETIAYEGEINTDEAFDFTVKQQPNYMENNKTLEFIWEFDTTNLNQFAPMLSETIIHYAKMTDVVLSSRTVEPDINAVNKRHQDFLTRSADVHSTHPDAKSEKLIDSLNQLYGFRVMSADLMPFAKSRHANTDVYAKIMSHMEFDESVFHILIKRGVINDVVCSEISQDTQTRIIDNLCDIVNKSLDSTIIAHCLNALDTLFKTQTQAQLGKFTSRAKNNEALHALISKYTQEAPPTKINTSSITQTYRSTIQDLKPSVMSPMIGDSKTIKPSKP